MAGLASLTYNGRVQSPILSIIVVSYNTSKLTQQMLASIFDSLSGDDLRSSDVEVIVVDNHSQDGSVGQLEKVFGHKIKLIANHHNLGFASANNQGVKLAHGEYVLLLNSDTIVHKGALSRLISCLKSDPKIGIVAASLRNPDGSYQPQGGSLPKLTNLAAWWLWPFPGEFPKVRPYQDSRVIRGDGFVLRGWVGGTAMAMKTRVYRLVGGLDEKIFMYAEDVDLCLRITRFGLKVGICASAIITHLGSASGSSSKAKLGEIKGLIYLFKKHFSSWKLPLLRLIIFKGALLRLCYFGILKANNEARGLYFRIMVAALG